MSEVRITNALTGGQKGKKPEQFHYLPLDPLREVMRLYARGAEKYDDHNWRQGYDWTLSIDALFRHFMQFCEGESYDSETQCHHLSSVVFHAFALMEWEKTHPELDNRYKPKETKKKKKSKKKGKK